MGGKLSSPRPMYRRASVLAGPLSKSESDILGVFGISSPFVGLDGSTRVSMSSGTRYRGLASASGVLWCLAWMLVLCPTVGCTVPTVDRLLALRSGDRLSP